MTGALVAIAWLCVIVTATEPLNPQQHSYLLQVYNESGCSGEYCTPFGVDADCPVQQQAINCSGGVVTHLSIYSRARTIIPSSIERLTALTSLFIRKLTNEFAYTEGTLPTQLGRLTALQWLDIADTQINGTIPTQIGRLTALSNLRVRYNRFTGSLPTQIGQLAKLSSMDLSNNSLASALPSEIGLLTKLTNLYMTSVWLTGTIPTQIGRLTSLSILMLTYNQLDGTLPMELASLASVAEFGVTGNLITGPLRYPPGVRGAACYVMYSPDPPYFETNSICGCASINSCCQVITAPCATTTSLVTTATTVSWSITPNSTSARTSNSDLTMALGTSNQTTTLLISTRPANTLSSPDKTTGATSNDAMSTTRVTSLQSSAPNTGTDASGTEPSALPLIPIVAGSVVGFVAIVAVAFVAICVARRQRVKARVTVAHEGDVELQTSTKEAVLRSVSQDVDEIDAAKLVDMKRIGNGSFGVVYRATYSNSYVAVKTINDNAFGDSTDIVTEARMLRALPTHDNVVAFRGHCVLSSGRPALVLEFCEGGSLLSALQNTAITWTPAGQLKVAAGAAAGLAHLHECGIVHRDIAARNILLASLESMVAKVTDFGMSKRDIEVENSTSTTFGATAWMAPEQLQSLRGDGKFDFSQASDVFSFGVLLFEIYERKLPWAGYQVGDIKERVTRGKRVELDPACYVAAADVLELMDNCFNFLPAQRPTMSQIATRLGNKLRRPEAAANTSKATLQRDEYDASAPTIPN